MKINYEILKNIGLTDGEIKVYDALLKLGQGKVSDIVSESGLKRGDAYNKLYDLKAKGFIEEFTKEGKLHFRLEHPSKIQDYIDSKIKKLNSSKSMISSILPDIVSEYNLVRGKPGISFFEGIEGIKKVLDDTLYNNPDKKLLTFSDVAGYIKHLKKWNVKHYAPQRRKLGIYEQVIIPDHPHAVLLLRDFSSMSRSQLIAFSEGSTILTAP